MNKIQWFDEKVLQRYVLENKQKWKINGKKVTNIEYNDRFDRYPDLQFTVEGETHRIPVEVEWTSEKFIDHDHDVSELKKKNGWIFVLKKNVDDIYFGVPQFEIPKDGFIKWVKNNGDTLARDTIDSFSEETKRVSSKLWIQYIGLRGNAIKHFEISKKEGTWGIAGGSKIQKNFKKIKKGDLVMFAILSKGYDGRKELKTKYWQMKSFKGYFKKIQVFKITSNYYYMNIDGKITDKEDGNVIRGNFNRKKEIWTRRTETDIYPHRFDFDLNPITCQKDVKIKKMSASAKEQLRNVVSSNFIPGEDATLLDCIKYGKNC